MEDVVDNSGNSTSPAVNSMHRYLNQTPQLFNMCLSVLPDDVFSESATGAPCGKGSRKNSNKRNKNGGRKGKSSSADASSAVDCLASITAKNNILEQKTCFELQSNLRDVLRKERKAKRETFDDLTNRYYIDKQNTKESIKRFKSTGTSDDDNEDDEDYTESQKK